MSNDYQSGAAPSAQMSHADLIAEMKRRRHDVWISEFRSYADDLEAAHKRELDAKDSVIQALRAELRQAQEKREITIAAQKAKAAAEGYADGKRDETSNNATVPSVPEVPSVPSNIAKLRDALSEILWCCLLMQDNTDNQSIRDHLGEPIAIAKAALATVGKEREL